MEVKDLYQKLLAPSDELVADLSRLRGDILILGAGGKMGPALTRLARQAVDLAGTGKRVMAASRFSEPGLQEELENAGIKTFRIDLLEDEQLQALPDVENVLFLAGTKFGTTGKEPFTWAMNSYLPGRVAEKYRKSRIVVFSTGNVYPLVPVGFGGATEMQLPQPVGEYAQSCLGRERVFQYFSDKHQTPILIYRLNYANDVTYGVLLEIARSVEEQKPIALGMGYVNVIWQGDANEIALRALLHCSSPAKVLNVTGPETLRVRWLAEEFGRLFGKAPLFIDEEDETALLSNARECERLFGEPKVSVRQMLEVITGWVKAGGKTLNKPTHFQEREGRF